jgi:hypothetical protein
LAGVTISPAVCHPAPSSSGAARALGQGRGEAVEGGPHRAGADLGQNQGGGLVGAGPDGAIEPGRGVAVVDHALGADAALVPRPHAASLLTHSRLVRAPELHFDIGGGLRDGAQRGGKTPLRKRSCAALSAFGWRGRVCCQDRSGALASRGMPLSR